MSGINGIGNNVSTTIGVAPAKPEATTTPVPAKTETPPNPPYIVDLTVTAVAKSMKLQGNTVEQISASMGVDIKTVDLYLSIKPSEPALIPAPAQIPATPVDSVPSTSASSTTTSTAVSPTTAAPAPSPAKSTLATPDLTPGFSPDFSPEITPGSGTAHGTSGIPAVPAALAPPASFSAQTGGVGSAPSAAKALGL